MICISTSPPNLTQARQIQPSVARAEMGIVRLWERWLLSNRIGNLVKFDSHFEKYWFEKVLYLGNGWDLNSVICIKN